MIATIVAILGSFSLPMALPFARRIGQTTLRYVVLGLWAVTALSAAVFLTRHPFDSEHPQRVFVVHMENVSRMPSFSASDANICVRSRHTR